MVCVIGMKGYPTRWIFVEFGLWFSSGLPGPPWHSPTAGGRLSAVLGFGKTFSSREPRFLDLFLHDGMASCFSILPCLHYRRLFDSEQTGGWTSFLGTPKIHGVLLHLTRHAYVQ